MTDDFAAAIAQLRRLLVGLGVIVFVISVSFSVFVWKITRNTGALAQARVQQIQQLDSAVKRLGACANEHGNYSVNRPDYLAIFRAHGIEFKPAAKP